MSGAEIPTRQRKRRAWLAAAKVVLSLGLLFVLFRSIGWEELLREARPRRPAFLGVAMLGLASTLFLNALPFHWVGRRHGLTLREAWRGSTLAWAWGMITPGRLGEFSVIHYLGRHGVPRWEVAWVGVLVRLFSLWFLLLLGLAGALPLAGTRAAGPALLLAAVAALGLGLGMSRVRWSGKLARLLPANLRPPEAAMDALLRDGRLLRDIALTQILRILLMFGITHAAFLAVGGRVPYHGVVLVNSITRVATMVPVSFNGLGLREGIQVALFERWYGLGPATVLSMGLWVNALSYLTAAGIAARALLRRHAASEE